MYTVECATSQHLHNNRGSSLKAINQHVQRLKQCKECPEMIGPVITGTIILSKIMSVGQAPGIYEGKLQQPFAWTAGKTLFKWFESIGVDEQQYREAVYMAAVCRCFPGKNPKGGDRVPSKKEVERCSQWLRDEYSLHEPELILPIGKLAIQQYLSFKKLIEVIGQQHEVEVNGRMLSVIPLPHPSGVSTWFRTNPGKSLLQQALSLIEKHPAWREAFRSSRA